MDDREGELALGEVLGVRLARHVVVARQVYQVVSDLKVESELVDERREVDLARREGLHQPDCEPEEAARLVEHHAAVLFLGGAAEVVAPQDVLPLPAVQVEQLVHEDVHRRRVPQLVAPLERQKVDVVGRVDCGRHAVDGVSHGDAPAERGVVLDVVDE